MVRKVQKLNQKDVPKPIWNWFNEIKSDTEKYTSDEIKLVKSLLTDNQMSLFWDRVRSRKPDSSNIISFIITAALLKEKANNPIARKFNPKKYYKNRIDRFTEIRSLAKKLGIKLNANKRAFSKNTSRNFVSRNDLRISNFTSSDVDAISNLFELSEQELIDKLVFELKFMDTLLDSKIKFEGTLEKASTGSGKTKEKNAPALYYCKELIWAYQQLVSRNVSHKAIADIVNLIMQPANVITENRVRNLVDRSISE